MKKSIQSDSLKELFGVLKNNPFDTEKVRKEIKADWIRKDRKLQRLLKK